MIPLIWNARKGKAIATKGPELAFGQGLEEGVDFKGHKESFRDDRNVLYLIVVVIIRLCTISTFINYTLKMGEFYYV